MKTYWLVHNFTPLSDEEEQVRARFGIRPGRALTVSDLRKTIQEAQTEGLEPFEDGKYKGWINPYAVHDIFTDFTSNTLVDIYIHGKSEDSKSCDSSLTIAGVRFHQTILVASTIIFGKNSDPLDVKQIYLTEE